jgi:hypothetical protein
MSPDDEYKKKRLLDVEKDLSEGESGQGGEDESGQGGKSGQIEFRDFLDSGQHTRDDLLPDEKKRLLSTHKDTHELRVKKQKEVREQRLQVKEGKIPLQTYRQGVMGTGMNSQYKVHLILANKAQFSGIERQVNPLATENVADTNEANRNELENQYRLRYQPENAPKFNPKPLYR